jgi:DNA-binding XRE family transcriptional regulator
MTNNLEKLRKKHHLSQSELAEMMGVSLKTVQNWEGGKTSPDVNQWLFLVTALHQKDETNSILCRFYGMVIKMRYQSEMVAHIEAIYMGQSCRYTIDKDPLPLDALLPRRAQNLVCDWIELRCQALLENWNRAKEGLELLPVKPLE